MKWFLVLSIFMSFFMYISKDPMKGSFFLVICLLCLAPVISTGGYVWCAYYICLIFLSGVFVILVYFSSLSKFMFLSNPGGVVLLFCIVFLSGFFAGSFGSFISINNFYFIFNIVCFLVIICCLLLFMNFISYFLSLGVAIRKM